METTKQKMSKKRLTSIFSAIFLLVILSGSIGYTLAVGSWVPPNIALDDFPSTANFVIKADTRTSPTTYYAVASNGSICWSSTNASSLTSTVIGNLTSGRTWKETVTMIGNFTFDSAVNLVGATANHTRIELKGSITLANGANSNVFYCGNTYVGDIEFCGGGVIDGNKAGQTSGSNTALINIYNGEAYIHDLTLKNSYTYTVYLQFGADHSKIQNCKIMDSGATPIKVNLYADSCMFTNNIVEVGSTFRSTGVSAFNIGSDNNIVANNKVYNTATLPASPVNPESPYMLYYGTSISGGKNNTVIGNSVTNTYHVGLLDCGDQNTITGNTVTGCGESGIAKFGSNSNPDPDPVGGSITANTVTNNGHVWASDEWIPVVCGGIRTYNTSHVTISGNIVTDNYPQGIFLMNSSYIWVQNNIVQNSTVAVNATTSNHISISNNDLNCTSAITYDASVSEVKLEGDIHREVTPTLAGSPFNFADSPDNLANAVDNNWATRTEFGNSTESGSATSGAFDFDMGATYRVQVTFSATCYSNTSYIQTLIYYSTDGSNYYLVSGDISSKITSATALQQGSDATYPPPCRYIRILFQSGAAADCSSALNEVEFIDLAPSW